MKTMMTLTITLFEDGRIQTEASRNDEVNSICQTVISLGMLSASADAINYTMKKTVHDPEKKELS